MILGDLGHDALPKGDLGALFFNLGALFFNLGAPLFNLGVLGDSGDLGVLGDSGVLGDVGVLGSRGMRSRRNTLPSWRRCSHGCRRCRRATARRIPWSTTASSAR